MSVSKALILGLLILSCMLSAASVEAAESKLIPQISVRQTYNDNINFSTTEEKDDMIFIITPVLRWDRETERTRMTANAEADIIRHGKEKNYNQINHKYSLGYDFRATELFGLNLNGSFIKDTTLDTEMEVTGLVLKRSDRDFYNIRPGISWYLTEASSLNLNVGYSRAQYEYSWYSDYNIYDATLELVHTLSEEGATVSAQGGYAHYDYETSDVDNYRLHLGLTYPFTERLKLTAWAGGRYTESKYEVLRTESDKTCGWLGYLALTRAFANSSVSVSVNRDVTASGWGETTELDSATMDIDYRFTELIAGKFSGSFSMSRSISEYRDTDEQLYHLRPSLSWRVTEGILADLSYQYSRTEYEKTGAHAQRNIIFFRFTIYWEELV